MAWGADISELGAFENIMSNGALQFNIADRDGDLLCPCCGMTDQFHGVAYDARGGIIGSDICGACLWEPGFDDDPMASGDALPTVMESLLAYRAKWLSEGASWRGAARSSPARWDGQKTLAYLVSRAPHLDGSLESLSIYKNATRNWHLELVALIDSAISLAIELRDDPASLEDNTAMVGRTLSMLEDTKASALTGDLEAPNGVRKLSMSRQVSDYIYDLNCPLAIAVAAADRYYGADLYTEQE
jgi:hypothetical protein